MSFTIMFKSGKTNTNKQYNQIKLESEDTLEEINEAFKNRCLLLNHLGFDVTKVKSNFSVSNKKGKLHGVFSIRQTGK